MYDVLYCSETDEDEPPERCVTWASPLTQVRVVSPRPNSAYKADDHLDDEWEKVYWP